MGFKFSDCGKKTLFMKIFSQEYCSGIEKGSAEAAVADKIKKMLLKNGLTAARPSKGFCPFSQQIKHFCGFNRWSQLWVKLQQ
jgi:hypothetical protein